MFRTLQIFFLVLPVVLTYKFIPNEADIEIIPTKFVPKCCNISEMFDAKRYVCVSTPSSVSWTPNFYSEDNSFLVNSEEISYRFGIPPCELQQGFILANENLSLLANGDLMYISINDGGQSEKKVYRHYEYCIETLWSSGNKNSTYESQTFDEVAYVCSKEDSDSDGWRHTLFAVLMLVSVFFLTVSALVNIILWEQQQTIHMWLQLFYTISLLLTFACLSVVHLWSFEVRQISHHLCSILGSLTHFFFMSVFFWLTSMNFDLWLTFGQNPLTLALHKFQPKTLTRTFIYYILFSLGFPVIFTITAALMDYIYGGVSNPPLPLPQFGRRSCHFYDSKSQFPYVYAPLGVLLITDMAFFVSTICGLRSQYAENKIATRQSTATAQDRKRFILFVKLFVVMGLLWIFEFLSWASLAFETGQAVLVNRLFMITDALNCLKGLAIFVIFVCKRDVLSKLKKKFTKARMQLTSMKMVLVTRASDTSQRTLSTYATEV